MFSTKLILFVAMAISGSSVDATPTPFKRDSASPALAAREPQFSVNIPNNIPVSGSFPNGINITPGTPSGSIVTSNRNGTFPFNLFGRDGATPALAAREPQFSVNIPNTIPVSGAFPNGITITPGTPSGSIVTSNRNSTLFGQFGFKREDATPALAAREPQFSVNIPNTIPVSGAFPNGISITPGTPSGSIVTSTRNGTFPFNLFGRDEPSSALVAREPQFDVQLSNELPVAGELPFELSVAPGTPGSVVSVGNATTGSSGFPFSFKA